MSHNHEVILNENFELGEGPIWCANRKVLFWVDLLQGQLHTYDPAAGADSVIQLDQAIGTVVPCEAGGLMLALQHGFAHLDLESGKAKMLHDPESDKPANRFNDGKCDPAGRFWAGTMDFDAAPEAGNLYCLDLDGSVSHKFDKVSVSNGIVWNSQCDTMYFVDTLTKRVDAFDYDNVTGEISNRRAVVKTEGEPGYPDGMSIDADDNIWVAMWEGNGVICWDPRTGKKLDKIELPANQITACAFAGDNLDELYITSASTKLSPEQLKEQPHAGNLFRAHPGVTGTKSQAYRGAV